MVGTNKGINTINFRMNKGSQDTFREDVMYLGVVKICRENREV